MVQRSRGCTGSVTSYSNEGEAELPTSTIDEPAAPRMQVSNGGAVSGVGLGVGLGTGLGIGVGSGDGLSTGLGVGVDTASVAVGEGEGTWADGAAPHAQMNAKTTKEAIAAALPMLEG